MGRPPPLMLKEEERAWNDAICAFTDTPIFVFAFAVAKRCRPPTAINCVLCKLGSSRRACRAANTAAAMTHLTHNLVRSLTA